MCIIVLVIALLTSCTKDNILETDCIAAKLDELNMVASSGEGIGCGLHIELFYYKKQQYFMLGDHCIDMVSYPVNCEGNILCANGNDFTCEDFFATAERIGIIGVEQ
jgi:hypothetical protein